MGMAQLTTKKNRIISGDIIIYTGDFAIVQDKTIKGDKIIITHTPINLADVTTITNVKEAEKRELLKEGNEND